MSDPEVNPHGSIYDGPGVTEHHSDKTRYAWVWPVLIVVGGVGAYINSLPNGLLFDDPPHLRRAQQMIAADLPGLFANSARAFADTSFWINTHLTGRSPAGYRAVNILIHLLNALLLLDIARRVLAEWPGASRFRDVAPHVAGVIALIWALHPVNSMAVSYIVQRHESLMALFFLLTLNAVLRACRSNAALWGVVAVLACGLGMMTKQVMVAAPIVVFLFDRCFYGGSFMGTLKARWPIYLGLAATWALLLRGLFGTLTEGDSAGFGVTVITPLAYLLSQGEVILHYLRLSVWPYPLIFDYTWRAAYPDGGWLLPSLIVAGMVVLGFVGVIRNRWWGVLLAWWFCILAPTSSILPIIDLANEYRLYLPVMAVVAAAVMLAAWLLRSRPAVGLVAAAAIALLFTGLIVQRNLDYRDELTMWSKIVVQVPHNQRAWHNLAALHIKMDELDTAAEMLDKALELNPDYSTAHGHYGRIEEKRGNLDAAMERYRRAHQISPRPAHVILLGKLLSRIDQVEEARRVFEDAMAADPDNHKLLTAWARLQFEWGDNKAAEAAARRALALDPRRAVTMVVLADTLEDRDEALELYLRAEELGYKRASAPNAIGVILLDRGDREGAYRAFERAMVIDPFDPVTLRYYGEAAIEAGDYGLGVAALERCVEIDRDQPNVWNLIGTMYARKGDMQRAADLFETAVELDPDHADAQANLQRARDLLAQTPPRSR